MALAAAAALPTVLKMANASLAMRVRLAAQRPVTVAQASVLLTAQRAVSVHQKTTARRAVHRLRRSNPYPGGKSPPGFFFKFKSSTLSWL